jgi:ferredoxin like protein
MSKVEEKLFQNRYLLDEGNPHIKIRNPEMCKGCAQPCTFCCPARCYVKTEDGGVELTTDGCLECGTCRIICCTMNNLSWDYPRGGYGVSFKFG